MEDATKGTEASRECSGKRLPGQQLPGQQLECVHGIWIFDMLLPGVKTFITNKVDVSETDSGLGTRDMLLFETEESIAR